MSKGHSDMHRRNSCLNKSIVVLALLWIATFMALLFVAHDSRAHATQHGRHKIAQVATVVDRSPILKAACFLISLSVVFFFYRTGAPSAIRPVRNRLKFLRTQTRSYELSKDIPPKEKRSSVK